jgi:hypothetical protein
MSLFASHPTVFWVASALIGIVSALIAFDGRGASAPALLEAEKAA